jgi:hypothetical protein
MKVHTLGIDLAKNVFSSTVSTGRDARSWYVGFAESSYSRYSGNWSRVSSALKPRPVRSIGSDNSRSSITP